MGGAGSAVLECLAAAGLARAGAAPGPARPVHRARRPGQAAGDVRAGRRRHRAGRAQALRQPACRWCGRRPTTERFGDTPVKPHCSVQPRSMSCCRRPALTASAPMPTMTNLTDALHIPDTQSERDERHLPIQRVGIKDLRYPLQLRVAGAVQTHGRAVGPGRGAAGREEGHAHVALRRLAGRAGRAAGRAPRCACAMPQMLDKLGASEGRIEAALQLLPAQARAGVGRCRACSTTRAAGSPRRAAASRRVWAEVGVPVKSPVPVLEGDLRLRRAQPALAGDHPRRAAAADRVARAGALRRRPGLQRALADAQARRREVGHRARLREPEVRRGPGARRGAAR